MVRYEGSSEDLPWMSLKRIETVLRTTWSWDEFGSCLTMRSTTTPGTNLKRALDPTHFLSKRYTVTPPPTFQMIPVQMTLTKESSGGIGSPLPRTSADSQNCNCDRGGGGILPVEIELADILHSEWYPRERTWNGDVADEQRGKEAADDGHHRENNRLLAVFFDFLQVVIFLKASEVVRITLRKERRQGGNFEYTLRSWMILHCSPSKEIFETASKKTSPEMVMESLVSIRPCGVGVKRKQIRWLD